MYRKQEGQGLVEYALILVLVAVVVVAALLLLGPIIENTFSTTICGLGNPCIYPNDDLVITAKNTAVTFDVTENDEAIRSIIDLSSVERIPGTGPTDGTVVFEGSGFFTYTPVSTFNGVDSFSYNMSNDAGITDSALVQINVGDAVSAIDDPEVTLRGETVIIAIFENDHAFPERDAETPRIISGPDNGEATLSADRLSLTYTPDIDFEGIDRVEYELCNSLGDCDSALVKVDVYALTGDEPAAAQTSEFQASMNDEGTAEAGTAEYMLEKQELLIEASIAQEVALHKVLSLMGKALRKTLAPPAEYAEENGDQALHEQLSAIIDLLSGRDYLGAVELLASLGDSFVEFPVEVRLKSTAKYLPLALDACLEMNGKQVAFQTFAEARQATVLFGALNAAAEMDEIWEIIEPRNAFIAEIQPSLAASVESGIEIMLDSGQNKYINLAEHLEAELSECSNGQ